MELICKCKSTSFEIKKDVDGNDLCTCLHCGQVYLIKEGTVDHSVAYSKSDNALDSLLQGEFKCTCGSNDYHTYFRNRPKGITRFKCNNCNRQYEDDGSKIFTYGVIVPTESTKATLNSIKKLLGSGNKDGKNCKDFR